MRTKIKESPAKGVVIALFPINVIGIIGFWILYFGTKPWNLMSPGLLGTAAAEFITALLCAWAFVCEWNKSFRANVITPIAAGMLYFGSIQGIGDAVSSQTYALIWVMGINIAVIPLFLLEKLSKKS